MKEHFTMPGRGTQDDRETQESTQQAEKPSRPESQHPSFTPDSRAESFNRRDLEQERLMSYAASDGEHPQPGGPSPSSARLFLIVALLFIIPLAIAVYVSGAMKKDGDDIPMIKAETDPVRVKPDNPGGFSVDHQEKSIYQTLSGRESGDVPAMMKILPVTEMPANMAETDEGHTVIEDERPRMITEDSAPPRIVRLKKDGNVPVVIAEEGVVLPEVELIPQESLTMGELIEEVSVSEAVVEEAIEEVSAEPDMIVPARVIPVPVLKGPVPKLSTKPKLEARISRTPKVQAAAKKTLPPAAGDNRMLKAGAGGRYAQLGAFSNISDAKRRYNELAPRIRSAMQSAKADYYFQPVAVSGKGTLYRLKIGPFAGDASGRAFCGKLTNSKIECMYVGN